jgi:FeS assembly protein IscX
VVGTAEAVPFQSEVKDEVMMAAELRWDDAEDLGIALADKYPDLNPLEVRFTDLHRYVTELEGFADDPAKSNEPKLEAIQMAWHEEYEDAKG